MDDPWTQIYQAILSGLTADAEFGGIVKLGNVRDHAGLKPARLKDSLMPADTPQAELRPTGGDFDFDSTNTTAEGIQDFELGLISGDLRLQVSHFPLKWATARALRKLGKNLGLPFVTHVMLSSLVDDKDDFEESKGLQGWTGKITITVRFTVQDAELLS